MLRALFALCLAALTVAGPVRAEVFPIQGVASFDILPGYATENGRMVAARIRLKDGWKTYWRAPGGNGIPPRFDWSGSENLAGISFHWPTPTVDTTDGVRTIGYSKELILPIRLLASDAKRPIRLTGHVAFGVCEDICIPVEARFSADLATAGEGSADLVRTALSKVPKRLPSARATCSARPTSDGIELTANLRVPVAAKSFVVVEYPDPDVWVEPGPMTRSGGKLQTTATLYALGDGPLILDRSQLRLTVLGGSDAFEISGCPAG